MAKCKNCGFSAPIWEWKMIEKSGVTKVPSSIVKQIEDDAKAKKVNAFAIFIFKLLAQSGAVPYHTTDFACPKCGKTEIDPDNYS